MPNRLTHHHVLHLVSELRRSAVDGQQRVANYDDDGLELCLAAGLMNDAADALETLLSERSANDDVERKPRDATVWRDN